MMDDYKGAETSFGFKPRISDAVSDEKQESHPPLQQKDSHPRSLESHNVARPPIAEQYHLGETASLVEKSSNFASDFITESQNKVKSSENVAESINCEVGFVSEVDGKRGSAGEDGTRVSFDTTVVQEPDNHEREHFFGVPTSKGKMGLAFCLSGVQDSDALNEVLLDSVVKDGGKESVKDSFLKTLEKSESGDGSIFVSETIRLAEATGFDSAFKESGCEEIHKIAPSCSLKVQVIDETALIQSPSVLKNGNGSGKNMGFVGRAKDFERTVNKIAGEDMGGNKEKKSRRRGKGGKKFLEANGKQHLVIPKIESGGVCSRRVYSRMEMEAMRFVNSEGQRKLWNEIYCALGPVVAKDYDNLTKCTRQKPINFSLDPCQRFAKKEEAPAILGAVATKGRRNHLKIWGLSFHNVIEEGVKENEIENVNALEACGHVVDGEDGYTAVEGEFISDSDEEYSSILRPAFSVDGDPDFDSGPPEDGLEYLRRVRWEAAKIPKVKVAKLDRSNLNKEQTVYMPKIPDIAKCPDHLLPSKNWEDAYLADFSELRLALSGLQDSNGKLQSIFTFYEFRALPANTVIENVDNPTTKEVDSLEPIIGCCSLLENPNGHHSSTPSNDDTLLLLPELASPKSSVNEGSINSPTLSAVLGMDSATRVSALRRRITSVEPMDTLSRSDCLWLFALCATVDTPLDADACASLRCLLRKCASLRAAKSEPDDEVVMLHILVTISGRYFGQLEK